MFINNGFSICRCNNEILQKHCGSLQCIMALINSIKNEENYHNDEILSAEKVRIKKWSLKLNILLSWYIIEWCSYFPVWITLMGLGFVGSLLMSRIMIVMQYMLSKQGQPLILRHWTPIAIGFGSSRFLIFIKVNVKR